MPRLRERPDLLADRLRRFTRLLHDRGRDEVRAVHRTRVASRRLRELLPVLQLDDELAAKLGRRLRKVTRRLGRVRELDVTAALVAELRRSSRYDAAGLDRVDAAVARERAEFSGRLGEKLPLSELRRIAGRFARVEKELRGRDRRAPDAARAWRWALGARVARRAVALGRAVDQAGSVYLPERLHTVRIAGKKLRYALELAVEAGVAQGAADLKQLKRVQEVLGRLHDFQVLLDRVRQTQASATAPDLAVWRGLDALVRALEDDCRRLHARYMRQRAVVVSICERLAHSAAQTRRPTARTAAAG